MSLRRRHRLRAQAFVDVHRGIGSREQFVGLHAGLGEDDADTGAGIVDRDPVEAEVACHGGLKARAQHGGKIRDARSQRARQRNEFIAAEAGEEIFVAQNAAHALTDGAEEAVADVVAVPIVDVLEPIEVDEGDEQYPFVAVQAVSVYAVAG